MDKLTISLAQLNVKLAEPEDNIIRAMEWIEQASAGGSDLILFPELWHSGYDLDHINAYAQIEGYGLWLTLQEKARQCQISIGGTLIEKRAGCFYNTFLLFDNQGSLVATYRKIHLFRIIQEDLYLTSGDHLSLADAPWGKTGLATCYDLRFPEIFREYTLHGARLILLPAEWPLKRLTHWQTLLRARAIENQIFVAAVNAAGVYQNEPYAGHSCAINPWGEILAEAGQDEELLTVNLILPDLEQFRERIPVLKDRRPDVYHLD